MNDPPRVSIVMAVYNRERFLRESIASLLRQTYSNFELILIDDGSTDDSREIACSFEDPRIRLIQNGTNLGIPATRNRALQFARGEYLAILDSDDIALPGRLARQVAFLDARPEIAVVGSWCAWVDEHGRRVGVVKRRPTTPADIRAELLFHCPIQNSSILGRTALFKHYRYRHEFDICEDYDLWARMSTDHSLANLPEILVEYRVHTQQSLRTQTNTHRIRLLNDQLTELGVTYNTRDLERHVLMARAVKLKLRPDRAFMNWANRWLLQLWTANELQSCYPQPSFDGALGKEWRKLCWKAPISEALSCFLRPPLARLAVTGLGSQIAQIGQTLANIRGRRRRPRLEQKG